MKGTKLAARYAKALFDLALERGEIEKVSKDIILINDVFHIHRDLRITINCPVVRADKKINILSAIFKSRVSEISYRYLELILRKKREVQITVICEEFVKLYKKYKNIITVNIYSPFTLDDKNIENIKTKIKGFTQAEVEVITYIKRGLIGGFAFKFDDYYMDMSVKKQLDFIKKELVDKSYQSNF
ncbi:MAG: ATP synthase F1 subunit delta [Bacteroidales bacterium]|jgi:F-type H+-transporting ATPase subunit delta|nr:ATP synthase F1 subunit delta [Bacteroidales bacterium]MDD2686900.1 ATP synthase F1 subunit delta [Bacteroidales bacterium]MDD3329694.1 ATP synthase F1 subunit delta [Bacteroidales bacterium]MDD3690516.1 ATP synthase F1 subunit delta [Bacteroidales bacterium]MDD4044712.1 ATP synthase F1 subunit delta [Bacteroidales bacterium]